MTLDNLRSQCCNGMVDEGTSWYICMKCGNPTDTLPPAQEEKRRCCVEYNCDCYTLAHHRNLEMITCPCHTQENKSEGWEEQLNEFERTFLISRNSAMAQWIHSQLLIADAKALTALSAKLASEVRKLMKERKGYDAYDNNHNIGEARLEGYNAALQDVLKMIEGV